MWRSATVGTVTEAPAAAGAGTVTVAIEVWDGRA